jgi:OmpA-OmpF porin, OOP family
MIDKKFLCSACILSAALTLSACQKKEDPAATLAEPAVVNAVVSSEPEVKDADSNPASDASQSINAATFDINKLALVYTEIGAFPYISPPDGFYVYGGMRGEPAKNGYSDFSDFSKLIMYTGEKFFDAEGKVARLHIEQYDTKSDFNQYKFDKSLDNYLENIGAVRIYKGKISNEQLNALNLEDKSTVLKYIIGDPWNDSPVRHYVLNHVSGKIMFQVWSNSAQAMIGVVELEGFKQSIKPPSASDIQKDIESTGKAVLHINFDTNKATLKPDGDLVINEIVKVLQANPNLKIAVNGYTDNQGSDDQNLRLSQYRASAVVSAIVLSGISESRLTFEGFGSKSPIGDNLNEEGRAMNRRVELVKQ